MHFGHILQTRSTFELKNEQIQVTNAVLHGRHVFASLSTGFGKSECFLLLPTCKDVVCSLLPMRYLLINMIIEHMLISRLELYQ